MSTAIASAIAVVMLRIFSLTWITQAMRLDSEGASLPTRSQPDYPGSARGSWFAGIAAFAGFVLNTVGLLFFRKNKLLAPVAFLAMSLVGMVTIAVIFKSA